MSGPKGPRGRLPVVLRNPAFGTVWIAQVLTQASARMFQVGIVWWLVQYAAESEPGLASGAFLAVSTLPAVALAPVVAAVIARNPHRSVMAAAAAGAGAVAACTAAWAFTTPLPTGVAYGAALLISGCQALFDPCLTTSVPELVDDADIEAATGFELSTQSIAGLAGGLLGPLVVDAWGLPGIVAGCAGAYLLAALLICVSRFPRTSPRGTGIEGTRGGGTAAQSAGEPAPGSEASAAPRRTLRQILAELPFIRRVLLCFAAANVFTTAVFVVMPLYTASVLRADGSTVALLEVSLGIGTLAGSFTGGRLPGRPTTVGAVCLGLMAASFALPGMFADRTAFVAAMVVAGWCVGAVGVRFVALFQRLVPPADKPGFFAVMQSLLGATFPLASLLFGVLGDQISPRTLCLVQAMGLVPVALVLWWTGARGTAVDERTDPPGFESTATAAEQHPGASDPHASSSGHAPERVPSDTATATVTVAAATAIATAEGGAR
ncbi:putative MFS family arabinose efflux permease [Streptomyces sp. Amel2xB2]|uniref:MFS transporter n=1 Tax=Streptomyces sp. Amel2xB2 TaxID=1305829 RepID=UPI000DB91506|nr:MFS transporter [Streptomyces sp. Amel2xB2]RAJ58329.1 putative MFS family arabinose efflux permease [Streptomyces sp. Amel2xB2]